MPSLADRVQMRDASRETGWKCDDMSEMQSDKALPMVMDSTENNYNSN